MIFTEPGKPAVTPTTTQQTPNGDVTIAAGTAIDFEGAQAGYASAYVTYDNYLTSTFTVAGTLWASDAVAVNIWNLKDFKNSGTLVSDSSTTQSIGLRGQSTWYTLENSGTILAVSRADAAAVSRAAAAVIGVGTAVNTGLIGAFSASGVASGIDAGALTNAATGQILAEGNSAYAVNSGYVTNRGLIEAVSHGTAPSVGIEAASGNARIDNYGIIVADAAIVSTAGITGNSSFVPIPGQVLTNHAGGVISGEVQLGLDQPSAFGPLEATINNAGAINGAVVLSGAYETVDTRSGAISGPVIFGSGVGTFLGSATANNEVRTGTGTDLVIGGMGNDLLVAGEGTATLVTAHGNSGIYGGSGSDLILAAGGDAVFGGIGPTRIVLADWTFAHVDGGTGASVLALPQGGRDLDLHAALATGRIAQIGTIELATGQTIEVSAGDATALAGAGTPLTLTGQGTGTVDLVGAWQQGANVTSGGQTWLVYALGGDVVRIAPGLQVHVATAVSVGAQGLDAVAGGTAAPTVAGQSWVRLPHNQFTVSGYSFRDLTVGANETLTDTVGGQALSGGEDGYGMTLVNHGTIVSTATGASGAGAAVGVGDSSDSGTIITPARSAAALPIPPISLLRKNRCCRSMARRSRSTIPTMWLSAGFRPTPRSTIRARFPRTAPRGKRSAPAGWRSPIRAASPPHRPILPPWACGTPARSIPARSAPPAKSGRSALMAW